MKTQKLELVGLAVLGAGAVASIFSGNANAGALTARMNSSLNQPDVTILQVLGATEGYDFGLDTEKMNPPSNSIDFYLKPSFPNFTKALVEARGPDSMTPFTAEIDGYLLQSSPINADLSFLISSIDVGNGPENNFVNKNIFADLYDSQNHLIGTYDVKKCANDANTISLTISNGPSYYMDIRFEKKDKFGFRDLERFSSYWMQECNFINANCDGFGEDGYSLNFIDFTDFANKWDPNSI